MSGDISKEEKERQLDEKIKAMRAKNAQMEQRKLEVDKDKQLAEKNRSSITVKTKFPESDPFVPPEAKFRTSNKARRDDLVADSKREQPPPPRRVSGRLDETNGPPPDPSYRFLADRMREGSSEEDEESEGGRRRRSAEMGGAWSRGGGRSGGSSRGGARGGAARLGRSDLDLVAKSGNRQEDISRREKRPTAGHHDQDYSHVQSSPSEKLVGGSGGRVAAAASSGPIEGFAQSRHHNHISVPPLLSPSEEAAATQARRGGAYIAPFRHTSQQQHQHHESYSAKVKSLLAEDTQPRYRGGSAEIWLDDDDGDFDDEEEHRVVTLSSPRKIEAMGGKITITRTLDPQPQRQPDSEDMRQYYRSNEGVSHVGKSGGDATSNHRHILSPSSKAGYGGLETDLDSGQRRLPPSVVANATGDYPAASSFSSDAVHKEFIPYNRPSVPKPVGSYANGISGHQQQQQMLAPPLGLGPPQPLLAMEEQVKGWEEQELIAYEQQQADWVLLPSQYGMMPMNPMVPVPSFPPPFFPPTSRLPATAASGNITPFYPQQHVPVTANYHMTGSYLSHQTDYLPYQESVAAIVTSSPAATSGSTPTAFNPSAQVFVPPAEQLQYQSPPPAVVATSATAAYQPRVPATPHSLFSNNNNNVNKTDPHLLVSLKTAPAPLPFNRWQDGRKFTSPESGGASTRFTNNGHKPSAVRPQPSSNEKFSQSSSSINNRLPPRLQKNRDSSGGGFGQSPLLKPQSLVEMLVENRRKATFVRPPPGHCRGLLIFGTSNIVNNLQTERLSAELNMPVRLIPAMKMDVFEEKVEEVSPDRDWIVLVHGLGNDARNIALRRKTDQEKASDVDELANKFCDLLESRVLAAAPHICVLVSLLLPRNDYPDRHGLDQPNNVRRIANLQITTRLFRHPRVGLIHSDSILGLGAEDKRHQELFQSDGYHLTPLGFDQMIQNWIDHIRPHVQEQGFTETLSPPPTTTTVHQTGVVASNDKILSNAVVVVGKETERSDVMVLSAVALANDDQNGVDHIQEMLPPPQPILTDETDNTVPDPFGSYTAPVEVVVEHVRPDGAAKIAADELPTGDMDNDELDDDSVPNLEPVGQNGCDVGPARGDSAALDVQITISTAVSQVDKPTEGSVTSPTDSLAEAETVEVAAVSLNSGVLPQDDDPASVSSASITVPTGLLSHLTVSAEQPASSLFVTEEEAGEGFIEDSYYGSLKPGATGQPQLSLPSLSMASLGPEESMVGLDSMAGPVSGFMEDSYLPPLSTAELNNRRTVSLTWSDTTTKNVKIGGSFNNWQPAAMERDADGGWIYSMDLAVGDYEYKFYVEEEWRLDPMGQSVQEDSSGNINHVLHVGL